MIAISILSYRRILGNLTLQKRRRSCRRFLVSRHPFSMYRSQCMKSAENPDVTIGVTYAGIVNRACERFRLRTMTDDQFECLIFARGLQSSKDTDIRTRIIQRIEQDHFINLQTITLECQRLVNLEQDSTMVERNQHSVVCAVQPQQSPGSTAKVASRKQPLTACWHCNEMHYARFCKFKRHRCTKCRKRGHKEE